jgi:hypothetical protein
MEGHVAPAVIARAVATPSGPSATKLACTPLAG